MKDSIHVRSHAKINWTLDVLHERSDGFHEIRTIYQSISLFDSLELIRIPEGIEIECNDEGVPSDETNLAYRAALELQAAAGISHGVRIRMTKRIPAAAGLGGGSSNAAATLTGLTRLWEIDAGYGELVTIATRLGSDVPFFLIGGTALGVGRGEEVYPLEEVAWPYIVLVNPGFPVSTADIYAGHSRLTRSEGARIIPFTLIAAKGIRALPLNARNDLQAVVFAAHPEIEKLERRLAAGGAKRALVSGSGATVFGVFDNLEACEKIRVEMRSSGVWSEIVRTVDRSEFRAAIEDGEET